MMNLNKLLYRDWTKTTCSSSATGINDKGQIAGTAYDMRDGSVHAVLLTPTGPPYPDAR